MDTAHRKIELQSPADLNYLIANANRAARVKIDLHFPPSAAPESGDDAMKKRVEELVDQYILSTFSFAKPNLSINGLEGQEMDAALARSEDANEELDAYDTRLASKILSLSSQIETLNLHLANLRRQAPSQAAEAWVQNEKRELERLEAEKTRVEDLMVEEGAKDVRTGAEGVQRWEDLGRTWERGLSTLEGVKEGIGGTMGRLEQAQRAGEYLQGKTESG